MAHGTKRKIAKFYQFLSDLLNQTMLSLCCLFFSTKNLVGTVKKLTDKWHSDWVKAWKYCTAIETTFQKLQPEHFCFFRFTTMSTKSDYLTYFYEILCEIKNYLWLFYGVLLTYEAAFFSDINIFYPRIVFFQGGPQKGGHLGFFTAEFSHFFDFFTAEFGHFFIINFQIVYC